MTDNVFPRRSFLAASAGTLASFSMSAYAQDGAGSAPASQPANQAKALVTGNYPVKAISSANGRPATERAYEMIMAGEDPLDAAIAGVTIVENDPNDTSVGYGGLPNEIGVVELDAAVMHGPTHRAGAVASLQNIKNPASLAKLVMDLTDHVLLVGNGALQFARAMGYQEENLLTERARKIWLYWKQSNSNRDDWLTPPDGEVDPEVAEFFKLSSRRPAQPKRAEGMAESKLARGAQKFERPTGTIHCAAMNAAGDISCTTTTSGLAFKIPGRVGDSPIVGAGLYVDNEVGSCGSTGRGEANLQNMCSFAAVELMRNGASPEEAGMEVLRRVAKTTEPRLRNEAGQPDFNLKFYLLAKDGRHAGVSMWGPSKFAVTDKQGTRLEDCKSLYRRS
jgi:N4-(beta-N-acetylglucosaminyl)-L-asparaginase